MQMNPSVKRIAAPALNALDVRVRQSITRRVDAMMRELAFLADRKDKALAFIRRRGWSDERLQFVFVLNSIYQQVLGPLQAVARGGPEGLGRTIPVRYGSTSFDRDTTRNAQVAMRDFLAMLAELQLPQTWLQSNTCGDIVFCISKLEEG
jgi:hypothetical protein